MKRMLCCAARLIMCTVSALALATGQGTMGAGQGGFVGASNPPIRSTNLPPATQKSSDRIAQPIVESDALQKLDSRIMALESAKQDLSAWATILIGAVSLLVFANVGLSVWQVGSLAQKEADKAITKYDTQFVGFLEEGRETIQERIKKYEASIESLTWRVSEIASRVEQLSVVVSTTIADMEDETTRALTRLHSEGERLLGQMRTYAETANPPAKEQDRG